MLYVLFKFFVSSYIWLIFSLKVNRIFSFDLLYILDNGIWGNGFFIFFILIGISFGFLCLFNIFLCFFKLKKGV